MKQANDRNIRLAGSTIQPPCHACAFFHSDAESYEVLLPFIKEGFEQGDKSFHIIDERRREEYMNRLRASGIDCSAEMTGQLEVRGWQDTHLRPGSIDQHATLALVGDVLRDAKENGYVNSAGPKEGWLSKIRSGRIRSVVTG
jgi:MEDS: MEthanogen/methylotroph, DcmR Sensory domain